MKILTLLALFAPALIANAVQAGPLQAPSPASTAAPLHSVALRDKAEDRDGYTRKAHDEMREWQLKLHEFSARAKAEGKEVDRQAKADLDAAWKNTETASRHLRKVSAKGWTAAKADYEKASQDLTDAWRKIEAQHS